MSSSWPSGGSCGKRRFLDFWPKVEYFEAVGIDEEDHMFLIGPLGHQELLIILALALLIFGAKKLPDLGKSLGEGIKNFKKSISSKEKDDASSDKPVPPAKDE